MTYTGKPDSQAEIITKLLMFGGVIAFFAVGGWSGISKFYDRQISHDKLTNVHYRGEWSNGEYRDCSSLNFKESDKQPELFCVGSTATETLKVFNVNFSGGVVYDEDKKEGAIHYWLCRRNNSTETTFSCKMKDSEQTK